MFIVERLEGKTTPATSVGNCILVSRIQIVMNGFAPSRGKHRAVCNEIIFLNSSVFFFNYVQKILVPFLIDSVHQLTSKSKTTGLEIRRMNNALTSAVVASFQYNLLLA